MPLQWPLGHYYSPVQDVRELRAEPRYSQVWPPLPHPTPGIDWRDQAQVAICRGVFAEQQRLEFPETEPDGEAVFFSRNNVYPPLDAWILEGLLRAARPRTVIEVGCGLSSLVTARVNREYLADDCRFICIDPYPAPFLSSTAGVSQVMTDPVQDVPLDIFEALGDRDVLFIDTSHTVKTGGDVAWIYNQVLPRLAPGVLIHVHDIFLPRDYPEAWVFDGWGWNEQYLVHSFLLFNHEFEVVFGARWMLEHHRSDMDRAFPRLAEYEMGSGTSLWIRRSGGRSLLA